MSPLVVLTATVIGCIIISVAIVEGSIRFLEKLRKPYIDGSHQRKVIKKTAKKAAKKRNKS